MRIIVCAKQVPDTSEVKIDPVKKTIIRDGVPSILNPDDANALEEALKVKDKYPDTVVSIVSMGPPQATDMLVECLAMGADEAFLLSDRAVGGSDTWATSNAITALIKSIGPFDMIFAGRQAIDGDTAQVGPQIAEKMNLPQVTYVQEFSISEDKKTVTVKRQLEDGYEEIKVNTPCMLTCIKELNTPRYMKVNGIINACKKDAPIYVKSAKDVEVDLATVGLEASPTHVFRSFTPAPKAPGMIISGEDEKAQAQALLCKLKEKHAI